ncbi:hypothetical protein EDB19DRAFT_1731435 [Suillus lakei]|nr:hypothetical protein EDB19DRAFT_1731435 [Suillus lakei]
MLQDYVASAPDGLSILSQPAKRRFPVDDTWVAWDGPRAYAYTSTLAEIIQEILQRHASGIAFREYSAGSNLDMQMKDQGLNINIRVDWEMGFIFGGISTIVGLGWIRWENLRRRARRGSWDTERRRASRDHQFAEKYAAMARYAAEYWKFPIQGC